VIFAVEAITVTFPDEAIGTHTPAVILLLVADAVGFLIESVVLCLADRHLLAGAANVDEISLLFTIIFIIFHVETSSFEWFPNRRSHEKRAWKADRNEKLIRFSCHPRS
jgi:hypothetical protein